MIETWDQAYTIEPQEWMFDKNSTGNFKVVEIKDYYIIHQEVERKKFDYLRIGKLINLIFFGISNTRKEFIPMTELITYSSDKANVILELVEELYKPIKRDKLLSKVLS